MLFIGTIVLLLAGLAVDGERLKSVDDPKFAAALGKGVNMQWDFDEEMIKLKLVAPTLGWIGVGFSQTGSMNGADMIMMGVNERKPYVLDTHAVKNGVPLVDESQDVTILSGYENATHTAVIVSRKRVTCDVDDMSINEGTYRIIWAFGSTDLVGKALTTGNYHGRNRGSRSIKLINSRDFGRKLDEPHKSEDVEYFDILAPNLTIPATHTHYYCQVFELPEGPKRHIIKIEPKLTANNEMFVHHVVLLMCKETELVEVAKKPLVCYEEAYLYSIGCNAVIGGWAIGASDIELPNNVGIPFGGPGGRRHILIQTHYDNPDELEFVDSSGMRLYYTDNLREFDAGFLAVSLTITGIWIPPKVERFRSENYCSAKCLNEGLDSSETDEITVIGTILHAHTAGRAMRLRHIRDGKELEPIAKDDFYDFNYQETQYVEDGKVKIRRGDSLIIQCDYDTTKRTEITVVQHTYRFSF